MCCADIYVIFFIEFKYKSHEFRIFSSYINFEVCTRKTLRIQNDLLVSSVPPISGRMYARSPIWSWGGATGYWGGAKSRSSSPTQPPTTTGVRLSAPTQPSARPCLECRKSLRRISRQTEFEFDYLNFTFSLHHLNVAIHHEQTKLIELLGNIISELLNLSNTVLIFSLVLDSQNVDYLYTEN